LSQAAVLNHSKDTFAHGIDPEILPGATSKCNTAPGYA